MLIAKMARYKSGQRRARRRIIGVVIAALLAAGAAAGYRLLAADDNPLPPEIRQQLNFSPLLIVGDDFTTDSYKYDQANKVMSYIVRADDGLSVTVTQQSQPEIFVEVAEYKERLLQSLRQYAVVQTSLGTVYLTRPPDQQEKQVGILIDRGLLVFMRAEQDLLEEQWRNLSEALEIRKKS